jgi:benzoyl-CoA reductase/2-hydroxyglutaryl-CoA dehydratase subunit BcrC/BadD/HgdB
MYERLAQRHKMYLLELPQKANDPDARAHWVAELYKLHTVLERQFSTMIMKERIRDAIRLMNRERRVRRNLAQLMFSDHPPLSGCELLNLKSLIACLPADLEAYDRILEELPKRPTEQRPARDSVRVLLTGVPIPHGAERVMKLLETEGGVVVCQENCTGLKPIYMDIPEDAVDPIEAIADFYWHLPCSVLTPNTTRMELLEKWARESKAECIVEVIWQCCLTYDIESSMTRELASKLDLPYLRIETDYSPNDNARIALRVAALYETARGRRA